MPNTTADLPEVMPSYFSGMDARATALADELVGTAPSQFLVPHHGTLLSDEMLSNWSSFGVAALPQVVVPRQLTFVSDEMLSHWSSLGSELVVAALPKVVVPRQLTFVSDEMFSRWRFSTSELKVVAFQDSQLSARASRVKATSPIIAKDLPDTTLVTPSAISANWTRLTRAELSSVSIAALSRIASRADGWRGPGSRSLSSTSLTQFLDFWQLLPANATEPRFSLTPGGKLVAEWYKSSRRHLDIEFSDDMAFFGYFKGRTELEGICSIGELAELLTSIDGKPLRWTEK